MVYFSLKKLLAKKELLSVIQGMSRALDTSITIQDANGIALIGEKSQNSSPKYPVKIADQAIGWVTGGEKAAAIAELLSYLAKREFETRTLAIDTLEKYEEINLFYDISSKIAACLDVQEIINLVIDEARKSIEATSASVMLIDHETGVLEVIAAWGIEYGQKIVMRPGEGIAGHVLLSGQAEIVNNVQADPRYKEQEANGIYSLICAPLVTQNGTIGVINISNINLVSYTSQSLKLFTAIASQAAAAIENALLHEHQLREERIKSHLERYLSPQLVQAAIEAKGDISLSPTKRPITVLFADIRNFTSKCEELAPEEIVRYLNEYFTHMVSVIFSHQGTVNKFVGDMIVAIFGAPSEMVDHQKRAIETAIEMQRRISTIPIPWIRENFATGIGISSGEVVVGNIGSPQHMDYTAIGDEVNIASRLQSMAQGGQILVSHSVYSATKDFFDFRELGFVTVKGRKQTVEVFEIKYHKLVSY